MIASFLRFSRSRSLRLGAILTLSASALLSACGSGSISEPLVPARVVSFGDGLSDLGSAGAKLTVNDGSVNIWVEQIAVSYGKTITASVMPGGLGFARANARVNTGASSIADQISAFLGANTIAASDLLVVDAGVAELVALANANASDAALASAADLAGKALGAEVKRLTAAGGKHVVIANAPDLGKAPLFAATRAAGLTAATRAFNDGIKFALADVSDKVLLVDNEAYVNTIRLSAVSLLGTGANISAAVCTTATALTCSSGTLVTGVTNYNLYLYADDRHFTPAANRLLGTNAFNKIRARW
jgi:outer membrane lipase/esterase